jgi:uncharacterized protein
MRLATAWATLLLCYALSPAHAASPSFVCTGSLSATEKTICADDGLAALDVTLAAAYKAKFATLSPDSANALEETQAGLAFTQKAWIANRNACGADKSCIRKTYQLRTGALTAAENSPDVPCRSTVGAKQAAVFVRQCVQVSTETHPPCNADNACELILSHNITRCAEFGPGAPKFCAAYPQR